MLQSYFSFVLGSMMSFLLFLAIALYMINLSEFQLALFARRTMFSLKDINDALENVYNRPHKRGKIEYVFLMSLIFYNMKMFVQHGRE